MNIPENYFIYINIAIVAIYLTFIIVGLTKGLVYEIASIFYTLFSFAISWFAAPVLASSYPIVNLEKISEEFSLLTKFINANSIIDTLIYFVIVFLILKLLYIVLSLLLKSFNKVPVLGGINRLLGGVFGLVNGTLVILVLSILLTLPIFKNGQEVRENTFFKYVNNISVKVNDYIIENIDLKKYQTDSSIDIEQYREQLKEWLSNLNKDE